MSVKSTNLLDREIGSRIRLRRIEVGMSQEKLAAAVGVTFQQVQKYEKGQNRVSVSRLDQIARALGVGTDFFLPKPDAVECPTPALPTDKESIELLSLFRQLQSSSMRRAIVSLVRSTLKHERTS